MGVVAPLALQATPPFEKVAYLRLVDSLGNPKLCLAMSESAVLAIVAVAILDEGPAQLRFLEVGRLT
jgi:hypothetical protein